MKKLFLFYFLVIVVLVAGAQPTITSFIPISAKPGDVVTITGTNFNTTAANNIVFFGATRANASASTTTSLTVTVPSGASFDYITVLNSTTSLSASSTSKFTPVYSPIKTNFDTTGFSIKVDFTTGEEPQSVAIGDLDGDGKPDIVVANTSPSTLSIFHNTSNVGSITAGSFAAKVDIATGSSPHSVAIRDMDGDGKPDLVVANSGAGTVSVFRNTSTSGSISASSFAAKVDFSAGGTPQAVAIGDINRDGKPDIVVANFIQSTISVFRNTSTNGSIDSSSFAANVDFSTAPFPRSIAIGDVEGDGKPDIVLGCFQTAVSILRNTTVDTSTISLGTHVEFTTVNFATSVALYDVDGNGRLDLVVANGSSSSVSVFRNTSIGIIGFGTFYPEFDFATGDNTLSLAIGDVDGDGRPDIATANYNSSSVSVLRNNSTIGNIGSDAFTSKVDFAAATQPYSVAMGDLDGDGKPDLVVANRNSNSISVLRNADLPVPPTITSFIPLSAKPGDVVTISGTHFNTTAANNIVFFGATKATITAASATSLTATVPAGATHAPISVVNNANSLMAQSILSFQPIYNVAKTNIATADFDSRLNFSTTQPSALEVGDLDGDGKTDLVVANDQSAGRISIFRNQASTGNIMLVLPFSLATVTPFGNPNSLALGDLDGDGKLDIVVTHRNSNVISIFRNISTSGSLSAASFETRVDIIAGAPAGSITLGDIDGDGKLDMVVVNRTASLLSIFRNQHTTSNFTTSSFAAAVSFATAGLPESIALGDADGDGKLDIALASGGTNVFVFKNNSTPGSITSSSLASSVSFAVNTNARFVRFADLDADQKLDLIVANYGSGNISVLRNTATSGTISTSSFATRINYTADSPEPWLVSFGDVDGDSKTDMVIARNGGTQIRVVRNAITSAGLNTQTFETGIELSAGGVPSATVLADLDGDAKPELIFLDRLGSNIGVFRNTDIPTWDGTAWQPADPSSTTDAVIASNNAPASFSSRGLIIDTGFTFNTTGITATIHGDIVNNGIGIMGNGTLAINANSSISGNPITLASKLHSLNGTLTTNGLVRISPTGAITGNYANISGSVTLQQNVIGQRGWRMFSNPFTTSQSVGTLSSNNNITISTTPSGASGLTDVRSYTNGSGWNNVTAATLAANTPYALFIRGLASEVNGLNYTGGPTAFTYNASGTLNSNVVNITPSASGFTLVGNPYAGPVNSSALTNGDSKSYFVYQIAQGADQAAQRTRAGGWVAVLSSSNTTPIPTFGVIAYQAGSATSYNVANTDINTTNAAATGLFRTQDNNAPARTAAVIENLALQIAQNGVLQDNLFIRQDEASTSLDGEEKDLAKLSNDNVNFYTVVKANNKRLAIDARDVRKDSSSIALGIVALQGNYTLKVTNQNIDKVEASLVDKFLNSRTILTPNTTYQFSITADSNSRGNNRFEVVFAKSNTATIVAETISNGTAFSVRLLSSNVGVANIRLQIQNAVNNKATIIVRDVLGKTISSKVVANGTNAVALPASKGVYIVEVNDGLNKVIQKVIQ